MTGETSLPTVHAGAAWIDGVGILVRGASGSGKSSLLLALLMADRSANRLIADDRAILTVRHGALHASAPEAIAGLIEVRGQGILRWRHLPEARMELVVDLEPAERCPRMPGPDDVVTRVEGIELPRLRLPVGQADGWIRVRAAIADGLSFFSRR